jgi:hypothetical protein
MPISRIGDVYLNGALWRVGGRLVYLRDGGYTVYLPLEAPFGAGRHEIMLKGFADDNGLIKPYIFSFEVREAY